MSSIDLLGRILREALFPSAETTATNTALIKATSQLSVVSPTLPSAETAASHTLHTEKITAASQLSPVSATAALAPTSSAPNAWPSSPAQNKAEWSWGSTQELSEITDHTVLKIDGILYMYMHLKMYTY